MPVPEEGGPLQWIGELENTVIKLKDIPIDAPIINMLRRVCRIGTNQLLCTTGNFVQDLDSRNLSAFNAQRERVWDTDMRIVRHTSTLLRQVIGSQETDRIDGIESAAETAFSMIENEDDVGPILHIFFAEVDALGAAYIPSFIDDLKSWAACCATVETLRAWLDTLVELQESAPSIRDFLKTPIQINIDPS